jgi:hypothetical protein
MDLNFVSTRCGWGFGEQEAARIKLEIDASRTIFHRSNCIKCGELITVGWDLWKERKLPSWAISGQVRIAPPGQEGWREAPGWWFKHRVESSPLQIPLDQARVQYVGIEARMRSGKRWSELIANPFCVGAF